MDLQIEAWRNLDPDIQIIGAIIGDGHDDLIAETERALQKRGIEFHYAIAHSDRETLYHFKRLVRDIDGFLLFPDNRILSRAALQEIMSEAARHQVQVAAFNDSMLDYGATFTANSVESDIAARIAFALNDVGSGNMDAVAPLGELTMLQIRTNPAMVRKFGLEVSLAAAGESVADAQ
jgi:ABC-type uncharacterized transport system substrate-binding protein